MTRRLTDGQRKAIAEVRDLAAKLDASAQAFDALVADVWRATGETHEPPADVAALLARVEGQREALDGYRLAAVDVVERIDGERQEPDFDMPAEFGAYVCDEVDHLRAAVAAEAHAREAAVAARARVERDVCEAAGEARDPRHDAADVVRRAVAAARREADQSAQKARDLAGRLYAAEGDVRLLRERCASERREGAVAMRDRIVRAADEHGFGDVVRGVRLPPVDASGEGAEAMRQAYATGRTDGAATMRDAAARRAAEKGRMYAGACTNVGDDIAAAIRALPLPEAP